MAKIEIKLDLDSNNPSDLQVITNLLAAFGGTTAITQVPIETVKSFPSLQQELYSSVNTTQDTSKITTTEIKEYSEEDLKAMDNVTLKDVATGLGIDWEGAEGKNTNAKLIRLITASFERAEDNGAEQNDDEVSSETKSEKVENTKEDLKSQISEGKTMNELKVKLGEKVEANREEIVAKLVEFGATKLSNLPEEHYDEMYTYLNSLK